LATKELTHIVKLYHLYNLTTVQAATATSNALDTLGAEAAAINCDFSDWAGAGSTWTFTLTECDTLAGTYTQVGANNVEWFVEGVAQLQSVIDPSATGVGPVVDSAAAGHNQRSCITASYVGGTKRFLKMVATLSGTPTTAIFMFQGLLSFLREVGPKAFTNWSA